MIKKLIVLMTKSDHDWGVLRTKKGFPKREIAYLECDQGSHCSSKPLECERLLCVITLDNKSENTRNVKKALLQCPDYDVVIGTHTQDVPSGIVLDLSQISNTATINYSTGWKRFTFMEEWCEKLVEANPKGHEIKDAFDRLFRLLKVPNKLETYLDAILNLVFDDKAGAVRALSAHASTIENAVFDAERTSWISLKNTILDLDISQREANLDDLNDRLFQFSEKELIDRYPYFSEME